MTAPRLAHIWRHPIKAHGREALTEARFKTGKTMPYDRAWAIAHEGARIDGTAWAPCANFSRGAKAPSLMAIESRLDETTEALTLSHPDRKTVTLHPERDEAQLIDWVRPLMPANRAQSSRVIRVDGRGMTDTPFPSISIANLASHKAVEAQLGQSLQPERWRANLWIDGLAPWDETAWVGQTLRIGDVTFRIEAQITRCLATTANTETGARDADTLGALDAFGHQEFGVYGHVVTAGTVQLGDAVSLA